VLLVVVEPDLVVFFGLAAVEVQVHAPEVPTNKQKSKDTRITFSSSKKTNIVYKASKQG